MTPVHPALPLFVAAALMGLVRPTSRGPIALAGAIAALTAVVGLPAPAELQATLLGFDLRLIAADELSRLFALILAVMAGLGTLYALHVERGGEHAATSVYAGASLGVVLAGDWVTLFLFWELMAISSTAVVWHGGGGRARAAGFRYLFVHLASGALLLTGILMLHATGTDLLGPVPPGAAFWLLLAGIAINAAIPPLHAWLTDAYPEASVTGSVFLSAFTTKTAVYVLIRTFPGAEPLIWAGVAMALFGVVYAVLENDIRRLLAYHIVSQVGYMVAGVGMGTALALNGAAAHAFCHILYKALLFMGAGAVLHATGRRKLTELGGLAPRMKAVVVLYMVGALSISGAPLFNGFVSKSMVVSAAAVGGWPVLELLLTLASVGTFLHTGLKLPYFTFFGPPAAGIEPRPLPRNMLAAMGAAAALCVGLGLFPGWLYARLPFDAGYAPYTLDHVVSAMQLLLGTGAAFALLLPKLRGQPTITLDTDWIYRRPLRRAAAATVAGAATAGRRLEGAGAAVVRAAAAVASDPVRGFASLQSWVEGGASEELRSTGYDPDRYRLPVGAIVLWAVAALGVTALLLR
ncbi:MAG TPA: Na(+)/H(+) antiporter subunit D [Thermoanaerobaculia bacterium]|nr:Na(+)/H(+) antiporter subunit D [Thermoanaerobaculia bacterium]